MKKDNVAFRISARGYNRQDVYNYLESVNRDIIERSNEYEKEIESNKHEIEALTSKNELLSNENYSIKQGYEDLNKQYTDQAVTIESLTSKIEILTEELEQKNTVIEEIDSATVKISVELDKLLDEYTELCNKYEKLVISTKDIDEYRKKAESYDKIIKRAMEKSNAQAQPTRVITNNTDHNLSRSAFEILDKMRQSQKKFSDAIINLQNETEALKEQINKLLDC